MSRLWSHSEDAYLAAHFATATMDEMIEATGRTKDAIYSRAKVIGLRRENRGRVGHGRFLVGTPFRPGSKPWRTNVRDTIIKELAEHTERSTSQLRKATGSRASTIWKSCEGLKSQNNIHTVRFQPVENSLGNFEAVYRIGAGVNAQMPDRGKEQPPHEIQPIPRPKLGLWNLCWPITTQGGNAAGKELQ